MYGGYAVLLRAGSIFEIRGSMKGIIFFGVMILSFIFSTDAMALSCYYGSNKGNVSDEVTLDNIVYLSGNADGSIIWNSVSYSRNITCSTQIEEDVYVYPYPKRSTETLPKGVKLGLIINGHDLGTFDSNGSPDSDRVDTHWDIDKEAATKTFNIQAYMVKNGDIDTTGVSTKISLFQLDGEGGLNNAPNANYNFFISGWNNVGTVDCSAGISGVNLNLSSINTDQAFAGTATQSVSAPHISLNCTSTSPQALSSVKSITGTLVMEGSALSGNSKLFTTNKDDLGFKVLYKNAEVQPNGIVTLDVPVSNGLGEFSVPLDIAPTLTVLQLNDPAWLFSEQGSSGIEGAINFEFTPTLVNTD